MTWNHRVIEHEADGEKWRAIHEVYYDDAGAPWAYTANPVGVTWNEDDDPLVTLDRMRKALDAPVLRESDFVGKAPAISEEEANDADKA